jgi:hypothetical protein
MLKRMIFTARQMQRLATVSARRSHFKAHILRGGLIAGLPRLR